MLLSTIVYCSKPLVSALHSPLQFYHPGKTYGSLAGYKSYMVSSCSQALPARKQVSYSPGGLQQPSRMPDSFWLFPL